VYPANLEHLLVDPYCSVIILGFTKLVADSLVGIDQEAQLIRLLGYVSHIVQHSANLRLIHFEEQV
jgi:hypothetical protein